MLKQQHLEFVRHSQIPVDPNVFISYDDMANAPAVTPILRDDPERE